MERLDDARFMTGDALVATAQLDSLDALTARPSFGRGPVDPRRLLIHVVDETARHAGHIDLLLDARP